MPLCSKMAADSLKKPRAEPNVRSTEYRTQEKKWRNGTSYESGSESKALRLPSPSPSVLRLLLSNTGDDNTDVGVCPSGLRPRSCSASLCFLTASSRRFCFFLTRPGTSFERLLGGGGNPSSLLVLRLLERSSRESTEFRIPFLSFSDSTDALELGEGSALLLLIRAIALAFKAVVEVVEGEGDRS